MKNLIEKLLAFLKSLFFKQEEVNIEPTTEVISGGTEENIEINDTNIIDMENNNYNGTVILLDNGHAESTPGKRSPIFDDGETQFFEYKFNRNIVQKIAKELDKLNIKYHVLVPEVEEDIKLTERANRANKYCKEYGAGKCLLISIHADAAGNGKEWKSARGWSVYTTKGVTKSDAIATIFFDTAQKILPDYNMKLRKDMSDGDPDYEENFTIIYAANCPAILTENLFYDNKTDVNFLMSEEGENVITKIHVEAIKKICGII